MKKLTILWAALAVTACATPPAYVPVEKSRTLALPKAVVWDNLVEHFAMGNIAIKTIERDSGIIYAERMFGTGNDITTLASCGDGGMSVPVSAAADLNVFVREREGGVAVTVNARFRQMRQSAWDGSISSVECNSLGVLEERILDAAAG